MSAVGHVLVLPPDSTHEPSPGCWCRPVATPFMDGTIWLHRAAGTGRDLFADQVEHQIDDQEWARRLAERPVQ